MFTAQHSNPTNFKMDHSDDDYDNLPASHPARRNEYGSKHNTANKQRGGWGEALELEHRKSTLTSDRSSVVAVDLNQFRNTEVGSGYQARHVVRQKAVGDAMGKTKIVHKNSDFPTGREENERTQARHSTAISTEDLLKNDGLRVFRKEIENILSSS